MNKFYIDIAYVTSVTVRTTHRITQKHNESDEEFLIRFLKSDCPEWFSTSTEDHSEFTKLRNQLENEGYIITVRNYWNGDRVLKTFYLNDVKFIEGDTFSCGSSMLYKLKQSCIRL